jgi:hypothetical protein
MIFMKKIISVILKILVFARFAPLMLMPPMKLPSARRQALKSPMSPSRKAERPL